MKLVILIEPENDGLNFERWFSFSRSVFLGSMLIFRGVHFSIPQIHMCLLLCTFWLLDHIFDYLLYEVFWPSNKGLVAVLALYRGTQQPCPAWTVPEFHLCQQQVTTTNDPSKTPCCKFFVHRALVHNNRLPSRELHLPPNGKFLKIPLQNLPFLGGDVLVPAFRVCIKKSCRNHLAWRNFRSSRRVPCWSGGWWRFNGGGNWGGWKHLQYLQVVIDPL